MPLSSSADSVFPAAAGGTATEEGMPGRGFLPHSKSSAGAQARGRARSKVLSYQKIRCNTSQEFRSILPGRAVETAKPCNGSVTATGGDRRRRRTLGEESQV